jgi:hypothetical protein
MSLVDAYLQQLQQQKMQQAAAAAYGSPVAGLSVGGGTYTIPGAGVSVTNNTTMQCNDGFGWNGSNCVKDSAAEVTIGCNANQVASYNAEEKTLTCSNPVSAAATAAAAQQKFTNVNGFKSKRERNVESFSQNTNGKCKARY